VLCCGANVPAVSIQAGFVRPTQGTAIRNTDLSLADSDSIHNRLISCPRLFVNQSVASDRDLYVLENGTRLNLPSALAREIQFLQEKHYGDGKCFRNTGGDIVFKVEQNKNFVSLLLSSISNLRGLFQCRI
jgi:hypothetical protein